MAVALSLAVAGLGTSGAFFSDTDQGNINGNIGTIEVTGGGGDGAAGMGLHYSNLLPGEPQTVSANYTNTGKNTQDVWVVFNNADALHALNDLGKYGQFNLTANGTSLFDSVNLKDNGYGDNHCATYVQANLGCWPLERAYLLASNLAPAASGDVSFTFGYTTYKDGLNQSDAGGAFNPFPVATLTTHPAVTGHGLPYQIVATQVGRQP